MAFDQTTRNCLTRFVSDARTLLTEEFTRQLQNEYGLDPVSGDVTPIERLTALNDRQRETAKILRETLEYYLAGNSGVDGKANRDVLDRIVREQAFTVLNRLCAFRMSEARGLVLESIAKGYQSKGFQLYARLGGSALGETGESYRVYLFSLMDEFAMDLPVLFDRFSAQGRLFPREAVLMRLLELINDVEIDSLWTEDETIGWIYQYFNSKEERKAMRDASQAPRNSRELAVRNQFFTPRYVVEFLTDNTLGRIWYEMTEGETALKVTCHYLVRRSNEIFLGEGEAAPAQSETDENLSQEDLLRQPVYIPHRPPKDPREIKMLDPACGSMHFGLYAFDLFEQIYAEAWELEERLGEDTLQRLADLDSLHKTYPDQESYLKDVPRLIIERNIHGVDIDPRAVQIAGLSLWLRAQKSWQAQGLRPSERPQIRKSNVVCAEPMPGDRQMLEEFLTTLRGDGLEALMRKAWHVPSDQKVRATPQMADALAGLVRTVWQEMELAGEAGCLLKIEETLRGAIATARKESEEKAPLFRVLEYGLNETQKEKYVQLIAREDQDFFDKAEGLVLTALKDYAEHAMNGESFQRRLFSGDAIQGFTFIDLCRKLYDVILMNPPFGSTSENSIGYLRRNYSKTFYDLAAVFFDMTLNRLRANGFLGVIANRTIFYSKRLSRFRFDLLENNALILFADLGSGVLDALVEAALSVIVNRPSCEPDLFANCTEISDKEIALNKFIETPSSWIARPQAIFLTNDASITYHGDVLGHSKFKSISDSNFEVKQGLATGDNYRFIRLRWEVPTNEINQSWFTYSKGGDYAPFYYDLHLVINWSNQIQKIFRERTTQFSCLITKNSEKYAFRPGLTYATRTSSRLSVRVLHCGCLFDTKGSAIFANGVKTSNDDPEDLEWIGYILNSDAYQQIIDNKSGALDKAARSYSEGLLSSLPLPNLPMDSKRKIVLSTRKIVRELQEYYSRVEPSALFISPCFVYQENINQMVEEINQRANLLINEIDEARSNPEIQAMISNEQSSENIAKLESELRKRYGKPIHEELNPVSELSIAFDLLSYTIGVLFGRWNINSINHTDLLNNLPNCFDPLPIYPPGSLIQNNSLSTSGQEYSGRSSFHISSIGILTDDASHGAYIGKGINDVLHHIWHGHAEFIEQQICTICSTGTINSLFGKSMVFFENHINRYSKSRRVAPIYWPLSTPSCSYTLWLYYHRLNDQTLYTCVNDFVDPKLKQVAEDATRLRLKKGRSAADEKELERLTDLEHELKDFREELLRVAKFWKPNLNDGVEITAAPLWKLFQHKPWQKRLQETWQKLEAGEYDWAHLAYSIWPERVREKCKSDKSLAIAHDLEELYLEPPASAKKKKAKKPAVDEETEGWFNDD